MRRRALLAPLAFALLLIPAPGASAATCTVSVSGSWTASGTWSCHSVPGDSDAVVIPDGKTVSLPDGDDESAASVAIKGGTLALGDSSELDAADFAAVGGGTISGPQSALLEVDLAGGVQATIDAGGLTVNGAYLNVAGDGTFGVAGPLTLTNGGWVESDVDTTWAGSAPWQLGGGAGTLPGTAPISAFEMVGGQLTIASATAAQLTPGGGDGMIELDGGATLVKQDATTTTLAVTVLLDAAEVHVVAGRLIGRFSGAGGLSISPGATLGLSGSGTQLAPPAIDIKGGAIEVEPGADVTLALPAMPSLHHIGVLAGASLDVSVDSGSGPVEAEAAPDDLAQEIAIGAGATLSIDSGGGILGLADGETLGGGGTLDGSLVNTAGTVAPKGALKVTGNYSQSPNGTLALDLRSASDGDSLAVDGMAELAGTLRVATAYTPAPRAAPLVLATTSKPEGVFARTFAPISAERGWVPAYGAGGVSLALGAPSASGDAPAALTAPTLRPAVPVVGGRTTCLPGTWKDAHTLAYQWLRGTRPIAGATRVRYRVAPADRGRRLSCRVTATSAGGDKATASSRRARVRLGLTIGGVSAATGGVLAAHVWCARSERRCSGSLSLLVAGHAVALGHFAFDAPGGIVRMTPVAGAARSARREAATVRAVYRNGAHATRDVLRRLILQRS